MNVDRLNDMIAVLRNVKARELPFDLAEWALESGKHACGTTACACGYAALDSTFQKDGFKLEMSNVESIKRDEDVMTIIAHDVDEFNAMMRKGFTVAYPTYNGSKNWGAVAAFFSVTEEIAEGLFLSNYGNSDGENEDPNTVITRIETLMNVGEEKFLEMREEGEIK